MYRRSEAEMRVLVLAPTGRDAELITDTLSRSGLSVEVCSDFSSLASQLQEGAGMAIVAEEAFRTIPLDGLANWIGDQPVWSDMPFLILTSSTLKSTLNKNQAREIESLGNFTLLERPMRPETVISAVRSALRARMRQYQMRSREEALVRANADLEQFAHSASHDLREPLRGIGVYSELLARRYGEQLNGDGLQYLNFVRTGATRMETLINALMEYAQAAGIGEEVVEPAGAGPALGAALTNLAESIRESDAQIVSGSLPAVRMREIHMQQLFQNLIGNAIKYRGTDPLRVRIGAFPDRQSWRFTVEDNGIGIRSEYKEVIFGIFKRLHSRDKYSGAGMGLAICQRIVERYRGRIWVDSEPGLGSTFSFTVAT